MSFLFRSYWNGLTLSKLRTFAYFVSPNETYTQYHAQNVYQSIFDDVQVWFVLFIFLEWCYYMWKGVDTEKFLWQDTFTSIAAGIMESTLRIFTRSLEFKFYLYIHENFHLMQLPLDSWLTWAISIIFIDFMYYCFHRMDHGIMLFWAMHQIHHSSNFMNFSNNLRLSLFEHAFIAPMYYAPCVLFLPPQVPLAHAYLNLLYQFWIHTELIDTVGPFEYFLNTPSHHRVHHGRNEYCIDKNFGGMLIIWDRLFGTFAKERKRKFADISAWLIICVPSVLLCTIFCYIIFGVLEMNSIKQEEPVAYGLVEPVESFDILYCQLFYFKAALWDKPKSMFKHLDKLKAVFSDPGWHPDRKYPIPKIEYPIQKYSPAFETWKVVYCLVHTLYFAEMYMFLFHYQETHISSGYSRFCAVFLISSLCSLGWLLDQKWFAPFLELLRALYVIQTDRFDEMMKHENSIFPFIHFSIFYVSCLIWAWVLLGRSKTLYIKLKKS